MTPTQKIYSGWVKENAKSQIIKLIYVAMGLFMALIPFDYQLFSQADGLLTFRISFILAMFGLIGGGILVEKYNFSKVSLYWLMALSITLVSLNYMYMYFYYEFFIQEAKSIVFIGYLLVIFFTTFASHRFPLAQWLNSGLSIFGLVVIHFIYPERLQDTLQFLICHISSCVIAFYFRNIFSESLIGKYNLLRIFLPLNLAEKVAISDSFEGVSKDFQAKQRYTVCLCSDWREYQRMTEFHGAEVMSFITENFYELVFESLEKIDPEGQYYANWTADELFVIFFEKNEDKKLVHQKALKFGKDLIDNIFPEINKKLGQPLLFDVGMASGNGLLGLQGPKRFKKTTIIGEAAGESKRMETEARTLRSEIKNSNPNPILILDESLFNEVKSSNLLPSEEFQEHTAVTKNIAGKKVFKFQKHGEPQSRKSRPYSSAQ